MREPDSASARVEVSAAKRDSYNWLMTECVRSANDEQMVDFCSRITLKGKSATKPNSQVYFSNQTLFA
jgi:hypothetical protein